MDPRSSGDGDEKEKSNLTVFGGKKYAWPRPLLLHLVHGARIANRTAEAGMRTIGPTATTECEAANHRYHLPDLHSENGQCGNVLAGHECERGAMRPVLLITGACLVVPRDR
jgi:hypothetical protein